MPLLAEPLKVIEPPVSQIIPAVSAPTRAQLLAYIGKSIRVERYAMSMYSGGLIEPGRVALLRGIPSTLFRPDRLMFNNGGFNILHLGMNGEPMLGVDEVPTDIFSPDVFGMRMQFATIGPEEEVIIAAVNRNKEPRDLAVSLIGAAQITDPDHLKQLEALDEELALGFDDDEELDDDEED